MHSIRVPWEPKRGLLRVLIKITSHLRNDKNVSIFFCKVLSLCTVPINPNRWDANAVLVRWLASPVNPLDLNIIEGRYSLIRPELPAVAGCEAVGSVERISSNVEHLKVGDRVIRFRMPSSDAANGVWAEWAIVDAGILLKIDPKIDLVCVSFWRRETFPSEQISAATLAINPPTAMALLREFVTLEVDDWVIQNAANSGVGRAVIQLAKCGEVPNVKKTSFFNQIMATGRSI
jgi:mitochondrial enoyl-[acyl-carrier protein] reductase / trans-2-enoyl-CoA reductase